MQELVTVQQMASGNFVKQLGGGTANCLAIQVLFLELFFEETRVECSALIKLQLVYSFGGGNRQRSCEVNPFTVQCTMYTILITAFVYQTIF